MFQTILFASLLLLAEAAYLDPSLQQQKPLLDSKPGSERVITLTLDRNLQYTYTPSSNDHSYTIVGQFQKSPNYQTAIANIPLNASLPGTTTFSTSAESERWSQSIFQFTGPQQRPQYSECNLGFHTPLLSIGIRKSGMISMPAQYATFDLNTPYIYVPKNIWDVILLATNTEQQARDGQNVLYVDCGALDIFPDLVFEVETMDDGKAGRVEEHDGDDYEDDAGDELIVRPEQYVLQTAEGKCMLLAKEADSCSGGERTAILGWAAVRGRDVVLGWRGRRIGFGK